MGKASQRRRDALRASTSSIERIFENAGAGGVGASLTPRRRSWKDTTETSASPDSEEVGGSEDEEGEDPEHDSEDGNDTVDEERHEAADDDEDCRQSDDVSSQPSDLIAPKRIRKREAPADSDVEVPNKRVFSAVTLEKIPTIEGELPSIIKVFEMIVRMPKSAQLSLAERNQRFSPAAWRLVKSNFTCAELDPRSKEALQQIGINFQRPWYEHDHIVLLTAMRDVLNKNHAHSAHLTPQQAQILTMRPSKEELAVVNNKWQLENFCDRLSDVLCIAQYEQGLRELESHEDQLKLAEAVRKAFGKPPEPREASPWQAFHDRLQATGLFTKGLAHSLDLTK